MELSRDYTQNPQRIEKAFGLILKIAGVLGVAVASKIWVNEISNAITPHDGRPPVVIGIGMIALLIGGFGGLFWWLYLSPIQAKVEPVNTPEARTRRRRVGTFIVL